MFLLKQSQTRKNPLKKLQNIPQEVAEESVEETSQNIPQEVVEESVEETSQNIPQQVGRIR